MAATESIREQLASLGLEPDASLDRALGYAYATERARRQALVGTGPAVEVPDDERVGASATLLGCTLADDAVRDLLVATGLRWDEWAARVGPVVPTALVAPPYLAGDDVVLSAASTYWEVFEERGTIDAAGLAWGIVSLLESEEDPLREELLAAGLDRAAADDVLRVESARRWAAERGEILTDHDGVSALALGELHGVPVVVTCGAGGFEVTSLETWRLLFAVSGERDTRPAVGVGMTGPDTIVVAREEAIDVWRLANDFTPAGAGPAITVREGAPITAFALLDARAVVGDAEGVLRVVDFDDEHAVNERRAHEGPVAAVAVGGGMIYSAGRDGRVLLHETGKRAAHEELWRLTAPATALAAEGDAVAVADEFGAHLVRPETRRLPTEGPPLALALARATSGPAFAIAGPEGMVLVPLDARPRVRRPEASRGTPARIDALAAGELNGRAIFVAASRSSGRLWLYDAETGEPLRGPAPPEAREERIRFQPRPKVARDYWTSDDVLGYGAYADAIADFIVHDDTKPPLTIGIKAPWGAGKSSLMRMVQRRLDPPVDPGAAAWQFSELRLTDDARARLGLGGREGRDALDTKAVLKDAKHEANTEIAIRTGDDAPTEPAETRADSWRPTVWFNPWMYQTGEQVWAGFAHEIIEQVTGRLGRRDREEFWLKLNLRRVDRHAVRRRIYGIVLERLVPALVALALALGGVGMLAVVGAADWLLQVVGGGGSAAALGYMAVTVARVLRTDAIKSVPSLVRGPVASSWGEDLGGQLTGVADLARDPDYQSKVGFLYLTHNDVKHVLDLVATPERPLVVFVDDLDRCSPGVVTQTIEAINLFLAGEFPNCVFVLAVEPAVVAAHIETAHDKLVERLGANGAGGDWTALGWRFLEKIIQLPLALPRPGARATGVYLDSLFAAADGAERPAEPAAREAIVVEEVERLARERPGADLQEVLSGERADVEQRLRERGVAAAEVAELAAAVSRRRVARAFGDSDPVVRRIVGAEALALRDRNPRELKRLLNVFRFYALVANARGTLAAGDELETTFRRVARLSVIAIRWPSLLARLGTPSDGAADGDGRPPVLLEQLEAVAGDELRWGEETAELGLAGPALEQLRLYLAGGPAVGALARDFL